MASITVRNLDDSVRDELRLLAARHGRSMEAEVRNILSSATGRATRSPNALMDLYWAGRDVDVDLDFVPDRAVEAPRVDLSGAEFG